MGSADKTRQELANEVLSLRFELAEARSELERARRRWGGLQRKEVRLPRTVDGYSVGLASLDRERTEREACKTALHDSEERYRVIFENAEDSIFIKGQDSSYVHINPAMEKLLGKPAHEIIGRTDHEIFDEHEGVRTRCVDMAVLQGETVREVETKIVRGTPYIFHSVKAPLKDKDGRIVGILGIARDVTGQNKAEEALREHQQMLQNILSASPVAISYVEHGRLVWTNETMVRMFGYNLEKEHLGKRSRDFYASLEEYERVLKIFKERVKQGLPVETEARFKRRDGSVFDGQMKIRALYPLRSNSPTISTIADVSDKKKADEALRESRSQYRNLYEKSQRIAELYRTLLDASPDPIVVCDVHGRPTYVNPAFTRVFEWELDELSGRRFDLIPLDSWMERQESGDRHKYSFETRCSTKDGRIIDVSVSGSVYHAQDGSAAGSVIQLRDVTEHRRLEEQLRQAVKMEAIGRLAGGVAHDFNNLLTAIIGYSDMLLQDMPAELSYRKRIFQISSAAKRASALTSQLLAFSRKQVLAVKVLDLNAVISGLEEILRRLIGEDVQLDTLLEPTLGLVEADPGQIEQILVNLVVNARDAMPMGGTLTIETDNVVLDEDYVRTRADVTPGRYVMISVTDTGFGMDEETRTRMFDPFFTTKPKGEGTGLGLSTAYGIIKQHRGHIAVYSEPNRGTIFKVYLPWTRDSLKKACEPQRTHVQYRGGETVLLVEDDDTVRGLAREVLELLGYSVIEAADPDQALATCTEYQGTIHLLVTDVVLPQMDGPTLFKEISAVRPAMRVLYVSGYTESFISKHGVLDHGVHFLQKPFTVEALAGKVRGALDACSP